MQDRFSRLADELVGKCAADEVLLLNFSGEDSDFVRFNQSLVRQAGNVLQLYLDLELIVGGRHASETLTLSGNAEEDSRKATATLASLRERLPALPEDPYLLYSQEVRNTERSGQDRLPATDAAVDAILKAGEGRDLVGILATGEIARGFANSLGQRNWFSTHSFHFQWCFYAHGDKAVKTSYAGFVWDDAEFQTKVDSALEQLTILGRKPRTIERGEYRTYLAPTAFADFIGMLGMGGYGLKSHRTKRTCLLKLLQ
jgi:predicted Zn-dependent protease